MSACPASPILSGACLIDRVLHTLIGYANQPSQLQGIVYAVTVANLFGLSRGSRARTAPAPRRSTVG